MSELISRQKLIEDIKKECDLHAGGLYEDEMLDIIKSQPPADQWIPCSERLPDESMDLDNNGIVTVLVTWEFDDVWFNGCSYCDVIDYDLSFNSFIISDKRKVTAWKPVEPYKGVE